MSYKELQRPSSFGFTCILQANNVSGVIMKTSGIYFEVSCYCQEGFSRLVVFWCTSPLIFWHFSCDRVEHMTFSHSSFFPRPCWGFSFSGLVVSPFLLFLISRFIGCFVLIKFGRVSSFLGLNVGTKRP